LPKKSESLMGRVLTIELTSEQRTELQHQYRTGNSHAFRQRCRMVLLKAEGLKTREICRLVEINSQQQVNGWIHRYKDLYTTQGINVLHNQVGQGRKRTFDAAAEEELIRKIVGQERQKLAKAKTILEEKLGKQFHLKTLQNFLKVLGADIND